MKKSFFITIVAILISTSVHCQITKGNWMVGGSGNYIYRTVNTEVGDYKNSVLTIRPNVGYFIKDKFVLGSSASFYRYKKSTNIIENFGVGLYSRYYLLKTKKMFNLFTNIHYEKVFYKHNIGGNNKSDGYNYGFKLGQVIFFNSCVGLEFSVGYEKITTVSQDYFEDIKVGIGLQIHLEK